MPHTHLLQGEHCALLRGMRPLQAQGIHLRWGGLHRALKASEADLRPSVVLLSVCVSPELGNPSTALHTAAGCCLPLVCCTPIFALAEHEPFSSFSKQGPLDTSRAEHQ